MSRPGASQTIFTLGFAGKSAREFFESLNSAGAARVLDIRRSNTSQLAGFTKKSDLPYFLSEICGIKYEHVPTLSPEGNLFKSLRNGHIEWSEFEREFRKQLDQSAAVDNVTKSQVAGACLLCACAGHDRCHRRVVAELLASRFPKLAVRHL